MKIFIDSEYKCHTQAADDFREVEVALLDDMCKTYVEGMRYIPQGETWTREDGETFAGEMLSPWKNNAYLEAAQGAYEDALAEMQPQIDDIFVALVEV